MRLQIAFDYLMVFVFVLLVFAVLFISFANQSSVFSNQESFAQLQAISQAISAEITTAAQAGSGYNATFRLPSSLGLVEYNVSVTKYGAVVASSNVFGQVTRAVSSSDVYNILSNSTYLSKNGQYYTIPTYNGSGFITIQNYMGTVCVDYYCPVSSNQPAQIAVFSNLTHAFSLNGENSYVYKTAGGGIAGKVQSVSLWFRPMSASSANMVLIDQGTQSSPMVDFLELSNLKLEGGTVAVTSQCSSSVTLVPGTWYFATLTYDGTNFDVYLNGSAAEGCKIVGAPPMIPNSINIGQNAQGLYRFNGSIADVQTYSTALTQNQVSQLYGEGITGGPVAPSNVVLWLPLDGNANDYSGGQNNPVQAGPSYFPTAVQLFAKITSGLGSPAVAVPVGFSTTLGQLANSQSLLTSTNSTGIAVSFVNQNTGSGTATVTATAFNGNATAGQSLIGWWPFNVGQGGSLYGMSEQDAPVSGNIVGASWAYPNYVASFDGQTGYVQIPNSADLQLSQLTITAWVEVRGQSPSGNSIIVGKQSAYNFGVCGSQTFLCYFDGSSGQEHESATPLSPGTWYMVTAVISGSAGTEELYLNGVPVLSGSEHISSQANGLQVGYANCCNQFFNGSVSNVQVYGSELSQGQILQVYQEGIGGTPIPGNTGWWPLDGDSDDYSGNGNNGTIYGNLQMSPLALQQGQASHILSASFSGQDSNVVIGYVPNSTSGNISVSAWVKYNGPNSASSCEGIFGNAPSTSSGFQLDGSGSCSYLFQVGNGGVPWPSQSNGLPVGAWEYIVATYNGKTGGADVYMNGVLFSSGELSPGLDVKQSHGTPYFIGSDSNAHDSFNGNIVNVQLYDAALSQPQVGQLYAQGLGGVPIQNLRLLAWYPLDGDSDDYSSFGGTGNAVNVAYVEQSLPAPYATPSISGYGVYFNGAGSNVIVQGHVPLSGDMSVTGWVDPVSSHNSGGREEVIGEEDGYVLSVNAYGNMEADLYVWVGGSEKGPITSPFSLSTNSWYSLAGTYNGNVITLYVNGVPVNSVSAPGSITNPGNPTLIGSSETSPYQSDYFNGTIADLQLYGTALTSTQVAQLYDSGLPIYSRMALPIGMIT